MNPTVHGGQLEGLMRDGTQAQHRILIRVKEEKQTPESIINIREGRVNRQVKDPEREWQLCAETYVEYAL